MSDTSTSPPSPRAAKRVTMPRWTREPQWIPESFRQSAPNKTPRKPLSRTEQIVQYATMFLNRKIGFESLHGLIDRHRQEHHEHLADVTDPVDDYWALSSELMHETIKAEWTDPEVVRGNIRNILNHYGV
ncbi:MAG TPA: hypothetical protein VJQ25_01765 [Nitrospira sp.]|nr:hypothetical protein [Nitrospira sp.]